MRTMTPPRSGEAESAIGTGDLVSLAPAEELLPWAQTEPIQLDPISLHQSGVSKAQEASELLSAAVEGATFGRGRETLAEALKLLRGDGRREPGSMAIRDEGMIGMAESQFHQAMHESAAPGLRRQPAAVQVGALEELGQRVERELAIGEDIIVAKQTTAVGIDDNKIIESFSRSLSLAKLPGEIRELVREAFSEMREAAIGVIGEAIGAIHVGFERELMRTGRAPDLTYSTADPRRPGESLRFDLSPSSISNRADPQLRGDLQALFAREAGSEVMTRVSDKLEAELSAKGRLSDSSKAALEYLAFEPGHSEAALKLLAKAGASDFVTAYATDARIPAEMRASAIDGLAALAAKPQGMSGDSREIMAAGIRKLLEEARSGDDPVGVGLPVTRALADFAGRDGVAAIYKRALQSVEGDSLRSLVDEIKQSLGAGAASSLIRDLAHDSPERSAQAKAILDDGLPAYRKLGLMLGRMFG